MNQTLEDWRIEGDGIVVECDDIITEEDGMIIVSHSNGKYTIYDD